MNSTLKRIISMTLVLMLMLSLSVMAFAAGTVTPSTDTVTVYSASQYGSEVDVLLAKGTKNFTIKKESVSVKSSDNDAWIVGFRKNVNVDSSKRTEDGTNWVTETGVFKYSYSVTVSVTGSGKFTLSYMIGKKTYTVKVKVLPYSNPLKTVTFKNSGGKGVNGGANLAPLFSSSAWTNTPPTLSAKTNNTLLKVVPVKGWVIQSIRVEDQKTHNYQILTNSKSMRSATMGWGTLFANRYYWVDILLRNTSNNATQEIPFTIRGANVS